MTAAAASGEATRLVRYDGIRIVRFDRPEAAMKESKGKTKKEQAPKANAAQPSQKGLAAAPPKPKK